MTNPFDTPDAPGSGDRFTIAEHLGELCIVKVHSLEQGIETSAGVTDVIVADVIVVDGQHAGEIAHEAWLFGKVLVGQLKRKTGRTILGRWGQGAKQQGKTPAWVLNPVDDPASIELAQRALAASMRPDPPLEGHNGGGAPAPARDPWSARPAPSDEPPF
jgi:hypothetical protein